MAFDGIVVAGLVHELKQKLTDGRIAKIAQPEADELLLTIKSPCGQHRLLISANASLPLIYLTDTNKPSPITAPNFCMLLRKHISNSRITDISQPKLERIICLQSNILMSWATFAKRSSLLKSWGNTATSFSVPKTERSLTVSSMYLHR